MLQHFTPNDLAGFVFKQLRKSAIKEKKPSEAVLKELFNTLYYTSLQTEEGQFIKITVTLLDHNSIEPDAEQPYDNWNFYPFEPAIPFSIKNLAKLSKAADPESSSLSVYYDEHGDLFIYGMIDQSVRFQNFLNYEREKKPAHPGIIQTMINGIGILNVMLDFQLIATLNQNTLIKLYPNVFQHGPIAEFIEKNAAYPHSFLEKITKDEFGPKVAHVYNEIILDYVIQSISRVLLKIKNYQHGGAILITSNFTKDLTVKYNLKYNRLEDAILDIVVNITDNDILKDEVKSHRRKGDLPIELHEAVEENELDIEDSYNELIGAVRFVSSLTCVDGLVLMSPHLQVAGFGAVINEKTLPPYICLSRSSRPSATKTKIDPKHFGTRHQSMFSYCLKHPDSLGFVVSQDGEIRAIKNVNGEVMMWENIKVYQFERSSKMPKLPPRK